MTQILKGFNMLTLNNLLRLIRDGSKLHICIHDISGILEQKRLYVDTEFKTHSKPFCNAAKSTAAGYDTCISCKDKSNRRAAENEDFERVCPFGMTEIIRPVEIAGRVRCIIYLGNIAESPDVLSRDVSDFCKHLGIDSECLLAHSDGTEYASKALVSPDGYYSRLAEYIRETVIELYDPKEAPRNDRGCQSGEHWCVRQVLEYIGMNPTGSISLSSIARLYFINEKYLGRIFKKQTGKTFHQYLTDTRLDRGAQLLKGPGTVIYIAHECGFQNVTYFNRCFKHRFGMTPLEYRKGLK